MELASGRAIVVAALIVGAPAGAPAASADTLVADPAGSATGTCEAPDPPCTLQRAVENQASSGDEVVLASGTYNEGGNEVTVPPGVNVHGPGTGTRPVIVSNAVDEAVDASLAGARLADLTIVYTGTSTGLAISNGNVGERLYVVSSGTVACNLLSATFRDSVCWDTGPGGSAIFNSNNTPTALTTTTRNVTAVATGAGSDGIEIIANGALDHEFDAKNVIADGVLADLRADAAGAGSTVAITLANSNYLTPVATGAGMATVTPVGTAANQTAPPIFVNASAGDFHQASGSPTIDAGTTDPPLGTLDLDGEARSKGAAPDIGADEFPVVAPQPGPGDTFPPDTKITDGPKKKVKKRHVKFEFGGSEPGVTFQCQLDDHGFKPCTSPQKLKGLKRGAHVYTVRAVDAAGNADPSPADRLWRIKKPKRKG